MQHRARRMSLFFAAPLLTTVFVSLALLAMHAAAPASENRPAGLVGRWDFDEPVGRLASDTSGRQNHATISDGLFVKGVDGPGLQLNGQSTTAGCPSSQSLAPRDSLSVEAWFRPHAPPSSGFPSVVRKEGSYAIRFSGGRLGFLVWKDGQPGTSYREHNGRSARRILIHFF